MAASTTLPPCDGAALVELNGVLYRMGGWNPAWGASNTTNRVDKSTDGGKTWVRIADAPWEARHTFGCAVGGGKIWVVGGDANSGHYQRDVWSAVQDGLGDLIWTLVTSSAAPLAHGRVMFQTYWHLGKLWIVGGQTLDEFTSPGDISTKPGSPYYDDAWSSPDGSAWTEVSTGNWWAPACTMLGGPVKDGYMWLVACGAYDTEGNPRIYSAKVIRSADGVTWELVTADAGFGAGNYGAVAVLGDLLVLVGGYDGTDMSRCAISRDGALWRSVPAPGPARHATSICAFGGELLVNGGPLSESAVWTMR